MAKHSYDHLILAPSTNAADEILQATFDDDGCLAELHHGDHQKEQALSKTPAWMYSGYVPSYGGAGVTSGTLYSMSYSGIPMASYSAFPTGNAWTSGVALQRYTADPS